MRSLYEKVLHILRDVSLQSIWNGFELMDFALYNNTTVYLANGEIPYDNRFLGNTSIIYNGKQLAIWNITKEDEISIEVLAANIVHEMFHSFQNEQDECRYPNDLDGLDYPLDLENFYMKYKENRLLTRAIDSNDEKEKMVLLEKFIGYREYRFSKFGEKIKYEWYTETLEGTAEYAGTMALKQIDYDLYEQRVITYKKLMKDMDVLFDIRKCSYYTGTLFLLLLDNMSIPIPSGMNGVKLTIFEQITNCILNEDGQSNSPFSSHFTKHRSSLLDISKECDILKEENIRIKEKFTEYSTKKNKLFQDFFELKLKKKDGSFAICGYDPMNMVKSEGKILCSHFVNLMNKHTKEVLFIQGPIVLLLLPNSQYEVSGYYVEV